MTVTTTLATRTRVASLCTGYAGLELALGRAGVDVDLRWYAENDPDMSRVLAEHHPSVPNLGDITALVDYPEPVDLLLAGFPCQTVSVAGKRTGDTDARWLWPDVLRAVVTLRPARVLVENVRNLVSFDHGRLFDGICKDLTSAGYGVRYVLLGACHIGAAHHRHRVFILAELSDTPTVERVSMPPCGAPRGRARLLPSPAARDGDGRGSGDAAFWSARRAAGRDNGMPLDAAVCTSLAQFADAIDQHARAHGAPPEPTEPNSNGAPRLASRFSEWLMCLPAGHVTDALPRVPSLKAVGNGVCPPQAAYAWQLLTERSVSLMAVDAEIIGLAQQRHRDQTHAIIDAAGSDPALAHRVLMVLAEALSGEAVAITNAKRKGHVGIARDWTDAAVRVRGVASRLESYVRLATPATTPELIGAPGAPSLDAMRAELAGGAPADPAPGVGQRVTLLNGEWVPAMVPADPAPVDEHATSRTMVDQARDESVPVDEHAPDVDTDAADILRAAGLLDVPNTLTGLVGPTMYPNGGPDPFDRPELGHASVAPFDPFTSPPPIGAELAPGESPFTSPAPAVERLTWVEFIGRSATLAPAPESSHSQASALAECGMRYQLGRLARHGHAAPERPGWALIGGKAVHAVINEIELIAYAGLSTVDMDPGPIWDRVFQAEINAARESSASEPTTWYASGRGKENYDFWRVEGRAMVARWIALQTDARRARTRIAKIADVPAVELEYRMSIMFPRTNAPADVVSHGFIDSVWIDLETHGLAIVDFKSGANPPGDTVQLGEYAWALVDAFGVDPTRNPISAAYWLSRTGEFTPPFNPLERHPREEISYRHVSATRQKQAGIFLPNQSNFCTSCGFAAQCPTRGRA